MPTLATKNIGSETVTRNFSDEVWNTGVPTKNGWRKTDVNTEVIAAKLPEQLEIATKRAVKVEEVVAPEMPTVGADADKKKEAVSETSTVDTKAKGKPGRKPASK